MRITVQMCLAVDDILLTRKHVLVWKMADRLPYGARVIKLRVNFLSAPQTFQKHR